MINDSKTPSGLAHVGSLRGVLIHDALARAARRRGMDARFIYGCDDMDPVDEIPHGTGEHFREFLGAPLFRAPPPPGLPGESMAGAYFGEFTSTFDPLGVDADFYFMSDVYRSGRLDETIDTYLRAASKVRDIYRRETGSVRPPDWLPFQPVCERCGRVGTTYACDYDGETVAYECRADLVQWAQGCGTRGRRSPFGGDGKLPWKLEWAAKWKVFDVSLEGGGKDHMGAGGSHKVAAALAREVLMCDVPVSFSYEFFTLAGAKMSSSKGIGATAGELAAVLPPELLRYLVLRVQPRRAFDFAVDAAGMTRAFAEYERLWRTFPESGRAQQQLFELSQVRHGTLPPPPGYSPPFDTMVSVVQQPHIDVVDHIEAVGRSALSAAEREWIERKRRTAEAWSQRFSDMAERLTVIEDFQSAARRLSNHQRAFLSVASRLLSGLAAWDAASIQGTLFDAARVVGIDPPQGFAALYEVFFGWPEGPRAGSLLEFVGRERACGRLGEVGYSLPRAGRGHRRAPRRVGADRLDCTVRRPPHVVPARVGGPPCRRPGRCGGTLGRVRRRARSRRVLPRRRRGPDRGLADGVRAGRRAPVARPGSGPVVPPRGAVVPGRSAGRSRVGGRNPRGQSVRHVRRSGDHHLTQGSVHSRPVLSGRCS